MFLEGIRFTALVELTQIKPVGLLGANTARKSFKNARGTTGKGQTVSVVPSN